MIHFQIIDLKSMKSLNGVNLILSSYRLQARKKKYKFVQQIK